MKDCKIEISNVNSEKLVNKLCCEFEVFDIKKDDKFLTFSYKHKDGKKIKNKLKMLGFDIKSEKKLGFWAFFNKFFSFGVVLGTVFSIILWCVSSLFITNIIVEGNINFTKNEVYKTLDELNIKKWSKKSSINKEEIEAKLLDIKYLSFASCIIKGNSVVISVKEQLTNSEVVNYGNFLPLVSTVNGKITSIKNYQGTLNKKVGDIVKIGDVIVWPYTISSNNSRISIQPLADIICDVWYSSRLEIKDVEYKTVRTNNQITNYDILCFNVSIFHKAKNVDYEKFEVEEKEEYLTNFLLPIKIRYKSYFETKVLKVENNFEQNKEYFLEKAKQLVLTNVNECDIIKDESYSCERKNEINIVNYTISVSKKIT